MAIRTSSLRQLDNLDIRTRFLAKTGHVSNMNESGDYIFGCEYIRDFQFNGWFSEPESNDLNAYVHDKHYTSCLMGNGLSFGWPVYSVFDEVKSFDGEIEAGFYYINTDNFSHSNGLDGMMQI